MEDIEQVTDFQTINLSGKTILIVEDDYISKYFLEELLLETGATLIYAIDGKEAVEECINNKKIDLVLLDLMLPENDGYFAVKEIRKINKKLPIIAQTAFAMTNDREKCIDAGCSDYITKPLNPKELFYIIEKHLF